MTDEKKDIPEAPKQETAPPAGGNAPAPGPQDEELFDLIIPPGVPRTILRDVVKKYDVKLVARKMRMNFANMDGDERELLAFEGKREVLEQVDRYMREELQAFLEAKPRGDASREEKLVQ